jgi:hypothetical protein
MHCEGRTCSFIVKAAAAHARTHHLLYYKDKGQRLLGPQGLSGQNG